MAVTIYTPHCSPFKSIRSHPCTVQVIRAFTFRNETLDVYVRINTKDKSVRRSHVTSGSSHRHLVPVNRRRRGGHETRSRALLCYPTCFGPSATSSSLLLFVKAFIHSSSHQSIHQSNIRPQGAAAEQAQAAGAKHVGAKELIDAVCQARTVLLFHSHVPDRWLPAMSNLRCVWPRSRCSPA